MLCAHDQPAAVCRSRLCGGLIVFPRVYANTWHRLPVFSIDVRYQPGAAHQKEAVSAITAPFRTPEIADPAACRVFDAPLSP
jgi:hypothetical protein